MRKVIVSSYNQDWAANFHKEKLKIKETFQSEILEIFHIGSTAVPGLAAKPIIDIMPVVHDITRIDQYDEKMIKMGYKPKGENGLKGRRYYQKGGDKRTHHVHIYQKGNKEIKRHLVFRDYLRAHPEEAKRYGDLKEQLAMRFPFDIDSYINGKHDLVLEIEKKAILWWNKSGSARLE